MLDFHTTASGKMTLSGPLATFSSTKMLLLMLTYKSKVSRRLDKKH